jgi:uncharacterized protein
VAGFVKPASHLFSSKHISRRTFARAVAQGAASGITLMSFQKLLGNPFPAFRTSELIADPNGLLSLPQGFRYTIVGRKLEPMSDGYRTPGRPDGMACFEDFEGNWVLMRNHEMDFDGIDECPYFIGQQPPPEVYNPGAWGGVSRVVMDPALKVLSTNMVLMGTSRNCAGGMSPWGWFSCEESVVGQHGYVFLCDPFAKKVAPYQKFPQFGKFMHEAAVVHQPTDQIFFTEDRVDGCFYRFLPRDPSRPFEGVLQALKLPSLQAPSTSQMLKGSSYPVSWVDLTNVEPSDDSLRWEAAKRGAVTFSRAEGMWIFGDDVYFTCTSGGVRGLGQVMKLSLDAFGGASLSCFAECTDPSVAEKVDSITVSPNGHIVVGEDGDGENHIRFMTNQGNFVDFASTPQDEICGVCFSPDSSVLFFNLQKQGLTLAVSGPFESYLNRSAG